jgi:hypothetical protein
VNPQAALMRTGDQVCQRIEARFVPSVLVVELVSRAAHGSKAQE